MGLSRTYYNTYNLLNIPLSSLEGKVRARFAHAHQYLNELDPFFVCLWPCDQKPSGTFCTLAMLWVSKFLLSVSVYQALVVSSLCSGHYSSAFGLLNPIDTSKTVSNYAMNKNLNEVQFYSMSHNLRSGTNMKSCILQEGIKTRK